MADNENNLSSDDEGPSTKKTRASYTIDFKIKAIEFAAINNISLASRRFKVDRKRIREWTTQADKLRKLRDITPQHIEKYRLEGGGRHLHDIEFEKNLLEWIKEQRAKKIRISQRMIQIHACQISSVSVDGDENCFEGSFEKEF
uniref:HTH CENPB-type domain-containing protein n=1 Tax=Meloidogyne floridensis TaxID=298350 RepID=A0A915NLG2_9BILA